MHSAQTPQFSVRLRVSLQWIFVRGLVMILMAIDHVRVYSGVPACGLTRSLASSLAISAAAPAATANSNGSTSFPYIEESASLPRCCNSSIKALRLGSAARNAPTASHGQLGKKLLSSTLRRSLFALFLSQDGIVLRFQLSCAFYNWVCRPDTRVSTLVAEILL